MAAHDQSDWRGVRPSAPDALHGSGWMTWTSRHSSSWTYSSPLARERYKWPTAYIHRPQTYSARPSSDFSSTTASLTYFVAPKDGSRAFRHVNADPVTGINKTNYTREQHDVWTRQGSSSPSHPLNTLPLRTTTKSRANIIKRASSF